MVMHHMSDHHGAIEMSMVAPMLALGCVCGAADADPLHSVPPCDWCLDIPELGEPAPLWHALWCKFCAWLFVSK